MPVNIAQWAADGLSAIQIGARGGAGIFTGFANLAAADAGTGSGMHRIRGAITAASPVAQRNRVRHRGENGYIANRSYEGEPPDFNLDFEAIDLDAEIALVGGTIYTLGQWDMILRGQALPDLQDTMVLLTRQATSMEAGSTGEGYENLLILSSKFSPVPGSFEWQGGVQNMSLQGSADKVLSTPWGEGLVTPFGKSDGLTIGWFSEHPCTMDAAVGDGTMVNIPLTYAPVSVAKTKAFNQATGAELTVSAVNTPANTATVSAAPANEVPLLVVYETTEL